MNQKLKLTLWSGFVGLAFAGLSLAINTTYFSDTPDRCPAGVQLHLPECASQQPPRVHAKGWPFIARETINDPRDGTDDLRTIASYEPILVRHGKQGDGHFQKYFNSNLIYYPVGSLLNCLFYGFIVYANLRYWSKR